MRRAPHGGQKLRRLFATEGDEVVVVAVAAAQSLEARLKAGEADSDSGALEKRVG